ncbi:MAG: NAD(P)H-dependent oxidoreductase subunit E [Firmicutes bacterium]|nr:NAD(P)H-dependent oxidoreductase subunit E [Bacillota bacterium]
MKEKELDTIINKYGADPSEIMGMLLDIQEKEKYLPKKDLQHLSVKLGLPLTRIYQIATFYEALSLKPLGHNQIHVCTGTACHVRGAAGILNKLEERLGIKPGEVTSDLNFGLKTVNCVGACALGPVVVVNGEYHGEMTALKADRMLKRLMKN